MNLQVFKKTSAILVCLFIVVGYAFLIKAVSPAKIQFTADTILSLSGIADGDLHVAANSEADSLSVSGSTLTIGDIPASSSFILKTSAHNNALKITPAGGVLGLVFESANLSSGNITQWTLSAASGTTVTHIVGVPLANTWYAIKTDGTLFNSFESNASGEVSFTYDGEFSTKVFTIEQDLSSPAAFDLVSPVNSSSTSNWNPTFSWNASTDPDLGHYELYIDGSLNKDNISSGTTSTTPANSLVCSTHTWYVKAIDNAGNSTDSSTFNLTISCGGGGGGSYTPPVTSVTNISISINGGEAVTSDPVVALKIGATNATKMAISNSSDFSGVSWEAFATSKTWTLTSGDGEKTVYAKFQDSAGISTSAISDAITLDAEVISTPVPGTVPGYSNGELIKISDSPKVYVIIDQKKKWIPTPEVFETLGYQWVDITVVDGKTLETIPDYEDNLIRAMNDYKVYLVVNGIKRHIPNPEIFLDYGFAWDDVKNVSQETIDKYRRGYLLRESKQDAVYYLSSEGIKKHIPTPEIFVSYNNKWEDIQVISEKEMDSYPASNLIQLAGDPMIYLIDGNVKRWIPDAFTFNKYDYDWNSIIEVNKAELDWYKEGSKVK